MTAPERSRRRTRPAARVAVAATLSATLLWAASPAVGAGWLAWIALVPVAAVSLAGSGRIARLAVPLCYLLYLELLLVPAFPFGLANAQWGDPVLPVLVAGSPVLAIALVLAPLFAALLWALGFGLPWGADRAPARVAAALVVAVPALAWTALDFVRAAADPGGLWGPLFLSQAGSPAGAIAALGGPWLVTFAIVTVNWALAAAVLRRRPAYAALPVALVATAVALGTWAERRADGGERVAVAAIQPGYDTAESELPQLRRFRVGTFELAALDVIDDLERPTRLAARRGAQLVVWPQAVMYADPRDHPAIRARLETLAHETGASILVGFFLPTPVREDYALVVSGSPPRLSEPHPKLRPLWYLGEGRARGTPRPLEAEPVDVAALLGVDTLSPRAAAGLLTGDGAVLASVTHDWEQSAIPHRAHARLLARAAGAPLVRADWRYGSAIWSADGTVLADADEELARATVEATVTAADRATPYREVGDLVGWLAVAGSAAAGLFALLMGRRCRRAATQPRRS